MAAITNLPGCVNQEAPRRRSLSERERRVNNVPLRHRSFSSYSSLSSAYTISSAERTPSFSSNNIDIDKLLEEWEELSGPCCAIL